MAVTQNTYTGNGSNTNFSITFEYLKQADVKASIDGVATTAFTLSNATTLSFTTAPANGAAVRIFRDTDISSLKATFFPGSAIKAEDLNDNFTQNNFATQETDNEVITANATAAAAVTTATSAVATADAAVVTAGNAVTTANAATATANTASTNASNAVTTANQLKQLSQLMFMMVQILLVMVLVVILKDWHTLSTRRTQLRRIQVTR